MKIPQQFSILKTQRCACMEFTFEKELKHGELRDPYTGFIVSRKNQIIVIGSWIVVATLLRYALLEADPYKWIGSLGAVTLTFALFYFSFKHIKKLFPYKQMFNTVMQNWYRNHYFRVGYIVFTAYTIFFVFTLQYGHDHFDTALNVAKTTHREFVPSFDGNVTKVELNNQNQSSKVYLVQMDPNDAVRIFQLFALLQSSMDSDFHSLLGTANWVMIYEEIEVAIFFVMMRTGRIFR